MFGTLTDADDLVAAAHALGLRVIVDLVPNHSSDQHEWFKQALREGPGSPLRDRFHFRAGKGAHGELPPNDWESIFGGPAWTRTTDPDGTPGEWYLHLFAPEQPDFNWDHPAVRDEFRSVLRFWLDLGVDGFRIDVAHGLVKAAGPARHRPRASSSRCWAAPPMPYFDQDGVHEIYRGWRRILDEYPGERIAVAEAWTPTIERAALLPAPRRAAPGVQLRVPEHRVGRRRAARGHRHVAGGDGRGGRAGHLGAVQPRRDPARHPVRQPAGRGHPVARRGRPGARPAPGPRGHPADAGAARLGVPLPGRGAGPAGRHRPAGRGAPGPVVLPRGRPGRLPRRLPGADPVVGHARRRTASARRGRAELAAAARELGGAERRGADRRPGLHPGAVPGGAARCAASTRRWARARRSTWLDAPEGVLAFRREAAGRRGTSSARST